MKISDIADKNGYIHPLISVATMVIVMFFFIVALAHTSNENQTLRQENENITHKISQLRYETRHTIGVLNTLNQDELIVGVYEYGPEEMRRVVGVLYYYFPTLEDGKLWFEDLTGEGAVVREEEYVNVIEPDVSLPK